MSTEYFLELPETLINFLTTQSFQQIDVRFQTDIIYEGHIPQVSYIILEGETSLFKRNRFVQQVAPRRLVGTEELLKHSPFKWNLKAKPGSKLLVIDKSTAMEILKNEAHIAHPVIKRFAAS